MRSRQIRGAAQTWILVVCLLIAAGSVYMQYRNVKKAEAELVDLDRKLELTRATLKTEDQASAGGKLRVMPATKDEESTFVSQFRTIAASNGVSVIRWSVAPNIEVAPAEKSATPVAAAIVIPTAVSVVVAGPYVSIRQLISQLQKAERLVYIADANWERLDVGGNSRLTCRIIRFVGPPSENPEPISSPSIKPNGGDN